MGKAAEELAARWAAFWDADSVDPTRDLYADAATIEDGQQGPQSRATGIGRVLDWRRETHLQIPDQRVTIVRTIESGDWTVAEYVVQGTSPTDACRQAQPGVVWLRVDRSGLITSQCTYFEWDRRRPDRGAAAGRVYRGDGPARTQAWFRGFAERLAELWTTDYERMCKELYSEDQTLDLMGSGPAGIQRNRAELIAAEIGLHERIPVRKMTVLDVVGEGGLLAFTHVIVSARSWQSRQRYWPVCLVLTLDEDGRVISDHSYVMNERHCTIPPGLAPVPDEARP